MGSSMAYGFCLGKDTSLLENDDMVLCERDTQTEQDGVLNIKIARQRRRSFFVYILSFLSAIGGFLFGYDTGVVAGALLPITDEFKFDELWKELFVSITVASAAIFAVVGGILNDRIGRKPTTLIASFIFAFGAVLLAAASNRAILLIGRFILGIGIGFASMTVPVYIAEASPPHLRGMLVSLNQTFITGGQFVSLIVSAGFCPVLEGWRYMLGLAAVPPVIQFIGFLFMPESPRWLISQGKDALAMKVLVKIRGTTEVKDEYEFIRKACDEESEARRQLTGQNVLVKAFSSPPIRRALIIGCTLQVFQQITGINTVMYYSATIVHMAGVSESCKAIWLASVTALSNFVFSFFGIGLVERLGRRTLLLGSLAGVTISLIFLGVTFQVEKAHSPAVLVQTYPNSTCSMFRTCDRCIESGKCGFCFSKNLEGAVLNSSCLQISADNRGSAYGDCFPQGSKTVTWATDWCPTPYSWMAILGMVLYLAAFAPGLGPMPWTINSEIYPLWARSFGNSLSTFFNWTFNLLISMTFLSLSSAITSHGAFYLYAGFGVAGFIIFYLILPETRGVPLEDMESLFSGSWMIYRKSLRS